ncbi:MAG: GNAT family N-acetyltransferase, partial [Alphaproteobacteria bacterium]|nr:GNAT family N-acetyltransferase [Alphaproteobacteria bacterium]
NDNVIGSIIAGFDGHRGWIYYLAIDPDYQGQGFGRMLTHAAEKTLKKQGCPKVELMIRPENEKVKNVYLSWGYEIEDRLLMIKWLETPPDKQNASNDQSSSQNATMGETIPVTISYLEMTARPKGQLRPLPKLDRPVSLIKLTKCSVSFYRYLYNTIGERWLWWEKRVASDEVIHHVVTRETTDQYLLSVGGVPAGWIQLDDLGNFEDRGQTVEIGYFGLFPEFIGCGIGGYLLDFAILTAWDHKSNPQRIQVNTCTLDHPAALPNYQKAGFTPYMRETVLIPDPRKTGVIPAHVKLAQKPPAYP